MKVAGRSPARLVAAASLLAALALSGTALAAVGDLGARQRVSQQAPDGNGSFDAVNPALAYNPTADQYLAVWEGDTGTVNEDEIFARLLSGEGVPLGGPLRVSTMGPDGDPAYDARYPSVAYNPTANEYLIAWEGEDDTFPLVAGEREIFVQRLTAAGAETGTDDQRISTMGPNGSVAYDAFNATAAYNPTANEYLIAWEGEDNREGMVEGEQEIFVQRLTAGGAETGADDQRISAMGPAGDEEFTARAPSVAYNPTANEYLIAWQSNDDAVGMAFGELEIFVQRLTAGGAETGADDQRISTMGPDGDSNYDAFSPAATYNPAANEYLIAWHGDDDAGPLVEQELEIFAQRLTAAGAETGADDQRISTMGPDGATTFRAREPTATYNPTANEYLIGWYGDDNSAPLVDNELEVYARTLEAPAPAPPPGPAPSPGPGPPPGPGPAPAPGPGDTEVTDPDVTIAKKITVKGKELKVKVSAGAQEKVTHEGTATLVEKPKRSKGKGSTAARRTRKTKLRSVTKTTEAGERTILRHKFKGPKKKRQRKSRKLKRKIKQGKVTARVRVRVELTDTAGNSAVEKRVARLKVRKGK